MRCGFGTTAIEGGYYVASDPAYRGAGFGRQTVAAGENWLRDRRGVKVQLLVRETNTKVIYFYEHLGFEVAPRAVMGKWLIENP